MKKSVVAIVGRPNVGKSTLFNRLIRRREAIVDDEPGITRDRKSADAEWEGRVFTVVDTGGFIPRGRGTMEKGVTRQVQLAVEEADLVLFVTDATTGITDVDGEVARLLRRRNKPVILAVNKADNPGRETGVAEFIQLGLGEPLAISAEGGIGTGDLLSRIVLVLGPAPNGADEAEAEAVRLAVVGRPNVGKSTFVNSVLGEERLLVTEIPGTTRDAVDVRLSVNGRDLVIVDTAGLRRRTKVAGVEYYSGLRTRRAVEKCDVACVMADAGEGLTQQDLMILGEAIENGKGVLAVINKWDAVQNDVDAVRQIEESVRYKLQGLEYVPVLRISAKTGYNVRSVLTEVWAVALERKKRIGSAVFNRFLEDLGKQFQPPALQGKRVRILYGAQVQTGPPKFTLFSNFPQLIKESYRKFVEKRIREAFGFQGVPLVFSYRKK